MSEMTHSGTQMVIILILVCDIYMINTCWVENGPLDISDENKLYSIILIVWHPF